MKKNSICPNAYAGRVTNAGSQRVEAPLTKPNTKVGTIKTGKDLRSK